VQSELLAAIQTRRVIAVCGSGGVGKTTTAAALGLHAARVGRRVLVCTIDPSRRLATSLGLSSLDDTPRELSLARVARSGDETGAFWAMHLDSKRTFDALVERHTPNREARDRILKNRFYAQVSSALAGSQEYMAMERLLDLSTDDRFDLVILDTPPTRHALDFLEAPDRMMGFLDTSVLKWFLRPYFVAGRLTLKVATKTGAMALKILDRAIGLSFLQDLSEFFLAFDGMYDGFKERASKVFDLLRDRRSAFVVVASPAPETLEEAIYFHRRLAEKKMPFVGFVVNRTHPDPRTWAAPATGSAKPTRPAVDADLERRLLAVYREHQRLARSEARAIARLQVDAGDRVALVPELEGDVHDLRGLSEIADILFGTVVETRAGTAIRRSRA
jgi:anion-transporting  ArsA/GET3 family ATPase